jgi:hypothetical protein
VRGEKVLLDADLANLYGVSTGRLNEQVKRNHVPFPTDFMFRLTNQELANLKSQFAFQVHRTRFANGGERVELAKGSTGVHLRGPRLCPVERLALEHDTLTAETRRQFTQVVETLRQLMSGPEPARRPIGFVTPTNS